MPKRAKCISERERGQEMKCVVLSLSLSLFFSQLEKMMISKESE
jgi:hypothetical protein